MINQFLATLDNTPTAPVNVIWPTFTARSISGVEATIRGAVIGIGLSRDLNFIRCLQLVNLVQESPLVGYVTAADSRITYTKQALRDRFTVTGVVVQDISDPASDSILTMIVNQSTPAVGAWTLTMQDSTHVHIVDDTGASVVRTIAFSGGMSGVFDAPFGLASFRFTGEAPETDDAWDVSYQATGASWIHEALVRLEGVNPLPLMNADLAEWYNMAPTTLDKLAATIAALGTMT